MIFLGLEKPVLYGGLLIFDPTTAQMALNVNRDYINAVYNDYLLARLDMKEFAEKYGNFSTPFAKDMDRYNLIVGGILNGIEDLYRRGVDPLRSSEGRNLVTRMIASVNPAELSAMKSNAKVGYAYLDALLALRKSGKFSQALEDFDIMTNGETPFADFATGDGRGGFNMWGRTSPIEATTLRDLTYDSYKNRTARALTPEDFKDERLANYKYDPRYQWSGYLYSDLMKNAPGASLALAGDPRAAFFRDQAKQMVIARGEEPTAEAVENQFLRNIADANTWALIDPEKKADEFALDNHRTANDIRAAGAKAAIEFEYDKKRLTDPVFMAAYAAKGSSGKGKKLVEDHNIFREAEVKANSVLPNNPWSTNVGTHTGYIPSGQYGELIDPIVPGQYLLGKNKDSGLTVERFQFNNDDILDHIYTVENGQLKKRELVNNSNSDAFTFTPEGQIVATKTPSGYRYFISGTLKGNKGSGNVYSRNNKQIWIEVRERGYVYDGK